MNKELKQQKLAELNKDICFGSDCIIYDALFDDEGNPNFLFIGTKNIHISSRIICDKGYK